MKNVRTGQLKTAIFLDTYLEDDEICEKLATYFDVDQVTSFHADDCEYPGIWIVYKDKIDK